MDAQKQGAGIIKEQGGSMCEDRGRISVEELTAQNRVSGEGMVMDEENKSNQIN